jgi:hypothetical protein
VMAVWDDVLAVIVVVLLLFERNVHVSALINLAGTTYSFSFQCQKR